VSIGDLHDLITNLRFQLDIFFFSSRRRHTRSKRDWSSDVCSSDLSWENFSLAWEAGGFDDLMRSSLLISGGVVPLTVLFATMAGFALSILNVWGGKVLSLGFVLGLTVPVELLVIALYYNLREVGLTDAYLGVILAEVALFLPFGVYWMQSHFSEVPKELVEAARMDGARDSTVLWRVLMPISLPAVTTLTVLVFMWSWNQFLLVLVR